MLNPKSCDGCEYFLKHGDTHICSFLHHVEEGYTIPENPIIKNYKIVNGMCPKSIKLMIERGA